MSFEKIEHLGGKEKSSGDKSRRDFLRKLAGASVFVATSGCKEDETDIRKGILERPLESWEDSIDWKKYSIRISQSVLDIINNEYDHETEKIFLLLANNKGDIVKTTSVGALQSSKASVGYYPGVIEAIRNEALKEGLEIVGTYHSHINNEQKGGGLRLSHDDFFWVGETPNNIIRLIGYGDKISDHEIVACVPIGVPTIPDLGPLGPKNKFNQPENYSRLEATTRIDEDGKEVPVLSDSEIRKKCLIGLTIESIESREDPVPHKTESFIKEHLEEILSNWKEARVRLREEFKKRVGN